MGEVSKTQEYYMLYTIVATMKNWSTFFTSYEVLPQFIIICVRVFWNAAGSWGYMVPNDWQYILNWKGFEKERPWRTSWALSGHIMRELLEITQNLRMEYPGGVSKQAPPHYKSHVLPLQHTCSVLSILFQTTSICKIINIFSLLQENQKRKWRKKFGLNRFLHTYHWIFSVYQSASSYSQRHSQSLYIFAITFNFPTYIDVINNTTQTIAVNVEPTHEHNKLLSFAPTTMFTDVYYSPLFTIRPQWPQFTNHRTLRLSSRRHGLLKHKRHIYIFAAITRWHYKLLSLKARGQNEVYSKTVFI
jgi:hypothetical protein